MVKPLIKLLRAASDAIPFPTAISNFIYFTVQIYHDTVSIVLCKR
jgi:hypothetical protein